ncbi:hypothetical protein [Usitatibacter palustris]|uniref:YggT family protein n=1 Tax=Usitatibacter palustris TaxID=2732487 RepID=A0A6M4H4G0_9PROT|nr:hypothetical protein [Usitatibacter palustris]QJR14426.1 hypothetical protein DSM104440_01222 [Usitatibacter palustris]
MLLTVIILKGLVELLALTHVAQAILFIFAGATRDRNVVYKIFVTVNRPIWKATRFITPRFIVDAHVGFVSFFLLSVFWAALVVAKVYLVLQATAPAR